MLENLTENWMKYGTIIFAALGLASAVARLTPNKHDDKIVNAILKFVNKLGLRGGPTD